MTEDITPDHDRSGSQRDDACQQVASDEAPDISNFHSLWVRWTDVRLETARNSVDDLPIPIIDVHLHRYCDLYPMDNSETELDVDFRFITGVPRQILRFTPLCILVISAILIVHAETASDIVGISQVLPSISPGVLGALCIGAVIWAMIVYLTGRVGLIDMRYFPTDVISRIESPN